ncbi:type II secretion system F family protein [Verrucomicrobiota bacterium]
MPKYIYKAKDGPTKTVEGEIDAESKSAAVAEMDAMGYSPVWIREKKIKAYKTKYIPGRRRVTQRDVVVFTRQLASLTKSGVPILRALSTISEQTESSGFQKIVKDLENTIRDGNMLSEALSKYPSLFTELYISMVRAGESGGVLDTILLRLAEAHEKEEEIKRKIQAATAYPLLIVAAGITTVFVLLTFFLPKVVTLFKDIKDLPLPTRMLIGTSNFFSDYWYWMVIIGVLFFVVLQRLASLEKGRTFFDRIKLHIPLLSRFIRQADIAGFARTLSLLIEAGIPIDTALSLSANTLRNAILQDEVEEIRQQTVLQGQPLSLGLKRARYFPVFVASMAAVGEEAGRLDESLTEIASFYEKEVDQQTRLVTSLLEPILILVVGVVVGFIVAAMLLPIFELGTGM